MTDYTLSKGAHSSGADGRCAMEWVAYIAGERHTDRPVCVDPPLQVFCTGLNDVLDDERRQKLRPYLARCIGTAGDGRTSERGYLCLDWIVRTYTPAWLELAGLIEDASRLRALPEIVNLDEVKRAGLVLCEARTKAVAARAAAQAAAQAAARDAAWAAARAAAGDAAQAAAGDAAQAAAGDAAQAAAWDAAWVAAWVAAWDAAWDAAGDAAGVAAWDAAWVAARVAAGAALAPTVKALQASAFGLLDRMLPTVAVDLPEPAAARARAVCEIQ